MPAKTLPDLSGFCGTTTHYAHWLRKLLYTDGIKHLADEAGAHWLLDVVASHLPAIEKAAPDEYFTLWRLVLNDNGGCTVSAHRDTNEPALISQLIEYTDFPEDFEWYVTKADESRWCMMLKSEY